MNEYDMTHSKMDVSTVFAFKTCIYFLSKYILCASTLTLFSPNFLCPTTCLMKEIDSSTGNPHYSLSHPSSSNSTSFLLGTRFKVSLLFKIIPSHTIHFHSILYHSSQTSLNGVSPSLLSILPSYLYCSVQLNKHWSSSHMPGAILNTKEQQDQGIISNLKELKIQGEIVTYRYLQFGVGNSVTVMCIRHCDRVGSGT